MLEPQQAELSEEGVKVKFSRHHHLSRSFRRMAERVKLREKPANALTTANRIIRALSQRRASKIADLMETREPREDLVGRGLIKPETIFGNHLSQLPLDEVTGVPEFVLRSVRKVETVLDSEGLYRIPGNAAEVQKLRMAVNAANYTGLESTKDITLVTSTLKLFFRELPQPIISESLRKAVLNASGKDSLNNIVKLHTTGMEYNLLAYLFRHLWRVSQDTRNKMTGMYIVLEFYEI